MATSEESKAPEQPELQRDYTAAPLNAQTRTSKGKRFLAAAAVFWALFSAGALVFVRVHRLPPIEPGEYSVAIKDRPLQKAFGLTVLPNGRECVLGWDGGAVRWSMNSQTDLKPAFGYSAAVGISADGRYVAFAMYS